MNEVTYIARIVSLTNGRVGVEFPDVPSAVTEGDNREHAIEMAKEVLELVLDVQEGEVVEINPPRTMQELEKYKELGEYEVSCELVQIKV